jgi:hypothetical protein
MAFRDIPGNPNWEYDNSPPNPGGALGVLYATGTNGIRTSVRGEEIYMNCRHKTLRPTQESVPNEINKTHWDNFIDFTFLLNTCVLFNEDALGRKIPLFKPKSEEVTLYGADENKSYVRNLDGQLVELQNWPTVDGFKKAIVDSSGEDIGDFSFRGQAITTGPQRIQLRTGMVPPGVTSSDQWSSTIGETAPIRYGSDFKVLFIQTRNGTIVRHNNESSGLGTYSLINLFNNNHSVPADDGYYVFIFSFGGIQVYGGSFFADDTRYNLFYAKVH